MNEYDEFIGNQNIYDCVVAKSFIGLLTRESNKYLSEVLCNKLIILSLNQTDSLFQEHFTLTGFPNMKGCVVPDRINPGLILTSSDAQTFFMVLLEIIK